MQYNKKAIRLKVNKYKSFSSYICNYATEYGNI